MQNTGNSYTSMYFKHRKNSMNSKCRGAVEILFLAGEFRYKWGMFSRGGAHFELVLCQIDFSMLRIFFSFSVEVFKL